MQTAGCLTVEVDLMFPTAAVGFTVNIGPERTAEGVPLRIRPRALVEGKTARFSRKRRILWQTLWGASSLAGHEARHGSAYRGRDYSTFPAAIYRAANARTLQELCQMLEDKFGAYPHSILV